MRRQARRMRRRFTLSSRIAWSLVAFLTQAFGQGSSAPAADGMVNYRVDGDAIHEPLIAAPGDAVRGRAIVADRSLGLCLLCHTAPIAEARSQGDIAPDLSGAGSRLSEGQLRMRLVDARRLNPASIMPSYHGDSSRVRVGSQWQGKALLNAQQIEDVVAYLRTLRRSAD